MKKTIRLVYALVLAIIGVTLMMQKAKAQTSTTTTVTTTSTSEVKTCEQVKKLSVDLGCGIPAANLSTAGDIDSQVDKKNDFVMNSDFGSADCKVAVQAKENAKEMKQQCHQWIKDQKKELGAKFVTGTCQEACSDCTMSMKKCIYKGLIHYSR